MGSTTYSSRSSATELGAAPSGDSGDGEQAASSCRAPSRGENPPYSYYSFYIYVNLCRLEEGRVFRVTAIFPSCKQKMQRKLVFLEVRQALSFACQAQYSVVILLFLYCCACFPQTFTKLKG